MTDATNKTAVSAAFPINADDSILFRLLSSIAISSVAEILPGHVVTMTLDASGDGLDDIPTPDTTGEDAWLWEVSFPDGREQNIAIGYDAATQDLAVLFAAVQSSTTPSDIAALITNKQDKVSAATEDNLATWDAAGQTKDSGAKIGDLEPALGNPGTDGFVLSSTIAGVRSWIAQAAGATWGSITGTLSDQTDLQDALDNRDLLGSADAAEAAAIADAATKYYNQSGFSSSPSGAEPLKASGSGGLSWGGPVTYGLGSNGGSVGWDTTNFTFTAKSGKGLRIRTNAGAASPITGDSSGRVGVNNITPAAQLDIDVGTASRAGVVVKLAASPTANANEWQDSGGTVMSAIAKNGAWKPPTLADTAAENNTVYYSSTQSKLVYKDPGGIVNNLY